MKQFIKDFVLCGFVGWCNECFWTGLESIRESKDKKLPCKTSVWMFPIYGMAAVLRPLSRILSGQRVWIRGVLYTVCIFVTEFVTGSFLRKAHCCPWDYSKAKWNIQGVIRLDYAPVWFGLGLLYEWILRKKVPQT